MAVAAVAVAVAAWLAWLGCLAWGCGFGLAATQTHTWRIRGHVREVIVLLLTLTISITHAVKQVMAVAAHIPPLPASSEVH